MANIKNFLNKLRSETGAVSFKDSRYGEVSNYIDTGSYALNRIISGSIHGGFPSGRVIIIAGNSETGKSRIAATCMASALKAGYDHVFYFDSEGGALRQFFESAGCDPDMIDQILVESVEDAQLKILQVYNMILEFKEKEPNAKFLCVLDSLGGLVAEKVLRDADKGKVASEMGGRAKLINSMVKAITIPALKTDTAMLIINHVYDDPSSLFAQKIKNQGGGKGLQYMSRLTLQCDRVLEKEEDKNGDGFYSGTNLKFFTVKNMLCRPSLETKIYLDFKKGFVNKYDGLFDEAVRGGFIISPSQGYYQVPSWTDPEKKWRQSQLEANEEVWNTFIEDFDKWSLEELKYSSAAKDAIAESEKSLDEIEKSTEVQ